MKYTQIAVGNHEGKCRNGLRGQRITAMNVNGPQAGEAHKTRIRQWGGSWGASGEKVSSDWMNASVMGKRPGYGSHSTLRSR